MNSFLILMFDKVANFFNSGIFSIYIEYQGSGGEVSRLMVANFSKLEEAMEEATYLVKFVSPCYKNVVSLIFLNSC